MDEVWIPLLPTSRPVVRTRTGRPTPLATMVATTSGRRTSMPGSSPPAATEATSASSSGPLASMAGSNTSQMAGSMLHSLSAVGRSVDSMAGSTPVLRAEAPAVGLVGELAAFAQCYRAASTACTVPRGSRCSVKATSTDPGRHCSTW